MLTLTKAGQDAVLGLPLPYELSLHDGEPGEKGENEISGGDPPYERLRPTWRLRATWTFEVYTTRGCWDAKAPGDYEADTPLVFQVPADTTLQCLAFWSQDGSLIAALAIPPREQIFEGSGTYILTQLSWPPLLCPS